MHGAVGGTDINLKQHTIQATSKKIGGGTHATSLGEQSKRGGGRGGTETHKTNSS